MVQLTVFILALAVVSVTAAPLTKRTLRTAKNIADLNNEWDAACVVGGEIGMCDIPLAKRICAAGSCGDNGIPPPQPSTNATTTILATTSTSYSTIDTATAPVPSSTSES